MKPILIKVGPGTSMPDLVKVKDYSNNKDYLGHNSENVPVFYCEKLNEKEIINVMTNDKIKKLDDGNYEAVVRQVYAKDKENDRKITLIELDVKGQNDYQYVTLYNSGYSEAAIANSRRREDKMLEDFDIEVIEDLEGKEVMLSVKTDDNGFTNYYVNTRREFFDWSKELKHDGECSFPCKVLKFYKTRKGNKYNFIVTFDIDGKEEREYINYDLDNEYRADSFKYVLSKLELTEDDADKDLTDKTAKLIVKRVTKGSIVYFNKRISFDRKQKEHYWKEEE